MSDIDHVGRAEEILDSAVESAEAIERMLSEPLGGEPRDQIAEIDARTRDAQNRLASVDRMHAAAQVHASLAIAEQLERIQEELALNNRGRGYFE